MSHIGERIRRVEDPRLLTGKGQYTSDISRPGLLFASFVRSPHAHARIEDIDVSSARSAPGIAGAFSAIDTPALGQPLPATFPGTDLEVRMPFPLAVDEVRFVGEAVAVVIADSAYRAADAADLVQVTYQPLPVVVDPLAARAAGAPLVHADVAGNHPGTLVYTFGEHDQAFESAAFVAKRRILIERSACAAIEPRCILADPTQMANGVRLTLFDSTQSPHGLRAGLSRILELEPNQIPVVAPDVGGGFGPKGRLYPEEAVLATVALKLGRPILWQATRNEDMLATYQGRGAMIDAELAADANGRLLGLRAHIIQDVGAYLATALMVPSNSAQHMMGPYHLPSARIEVEGVHTNKTPLTPLRGGGREVGAYVIERMMDHLAREAGLDPITIRERNVLHADEFPFDTGYQSRFGGTVVYDSGDFPGCLAQAKELIGYDAFVRQQQSERNQGLYRGISVTLFIESTGFGAETARATLLPDGRVSLKVGAPSNGQGHATSLAQLCAARLGLPVESLVYSSGDTAEVDQGVGTFGSRIAVTAGNASARAGTHLRDVILAAAGDELEASPADLEIVGGQIQVRGVPGRGLGLDDLARRAAARQSTDDPDNTRGDALSVEAQFESDSGAAFAGGAHAAIVEVDVETGLVTVEKYVVVHDCGTVINPMIVDGQVHGGVIHGIGNALTEYMFCDSDGQPQTASFINYGLTQIGSTPEIEVIHHATPSPRNPEGIKGAGEGGTIGALATIARAVEQALEPFGIEINELPVRPAMIAQACAKQTLSS